VPAEITVKITARSKWCYIQTLEGVTVKLSTPTTPAPSATSQPDGQQGRLSPRNYAPHLTDPDPPQPVMTPLQSKLAAQKAKQLMQSKGYLKK
jgi:hypothetical protein